MALKKFGPAKGNAKNTGAPGPTPAPTTDALVSLTKAKDTAWGRGTYGGNAYNGPVSLAPGEKLSAPLGDAIADPGLAAIAAGHGDTGAPQTRDVSSQPYPTAFGMKGASKGATVPTKTGAK
jgi:hypothetical protein